MTERKITYALNKIKACKEQGFETEAVIRSYHLNVNLIRYILSVASPEQIITDKKPRVLVRMFLAQMTLRPELKSIINKKSLKSLKPWLKKMDEFFKSLKLAMPVNHSAVQLETDKIFGILKISANKILIKSAI